jgi:hypothetical protein
MRDLLLLAVQLIVTLAKLARPGGVRSVIANLCSLNNSSSSAAVPVGAPRL